MKLVAVIGVLAILYAQVYALWDVLIHQPERPVIVRAAWFVGILLLPVLGTVAYLRMGPGAAHWPPWESAEED
jgi:hypothetical protein